MTESFVKSRRGILEHLQQHRINTSQFAVFQLLVLLADKANGVVWIDAPLIVAQYFHDMPLKTAQAALASLKAKGYIKSFQQQGSRGSYPVMVNKYEITVGGLKGRLTNADQTVDWRQPAVSDRTEDGREHRSELGSEDGTPYSRPQETQDLKTSSKSIHSSEHASEASPMVSPESETSTPDDRPPVDGKTYEKLEDVPRSDQARILTSRLFIDLGEPKDKRKQLPEWRRELEPLCDQFECSDRSQY